MRQIKFKIWDKQTEKMYHDVLTEMGDCDNWDDDTSMWDVAYSLEKGDQERFVGLQFTGLKDSSGVDIYEGDILQITTLYPKGGLTMTDVVVFDLGAWRWNGYELHRQKDHAMYVKGNIFENANT